MGTIIAFMVSNIYRRIALDKNKLISMATERNSKEIEKLKSQLEIESKNESIIYENMKRMEKVLEYFDIDRIFIVDKDGYVKKSAGNVIKQIDLSEGEGSRLTIKGNNKFIATNIIGINEESYLVYLNENYIYNDMIIFQVTSIATIVIFLVLISGRIKYISEIVREVRIIATGDFSRRINLKYKNELTDLAEDINYMVQELQEQELNQREFITNISHDLRTPLTTILGYSRMIEQKVYSNEEDLARYVAVINNKGIYLKGMLDDFFEYAKLYSKDINLNKVKINLNELIMQLLDGEEFNFQNRNLNLCIKLQNKSIYTYGESILIARALNNLINNTLKYSKENTIVNITLKEEVVNKINYGVFVIDNIPQEKISKEEVCNFFKRLYKVDKSRNKDGSGLGLAITQEIVKIHEGIINVNLIEGRISFKVMFKAI